MNNSRARMTAAWCGAAAALTLAVGFAVADAPAEPALAASPIATPAPPPGPGGALPVQPVGGGGCVIGLNCGCIRNVTCPKAPAHPPTAARNKPPDPAPAPQNP